MRRSEAVALLAAAVAVFAAGAAWLLGPFGLLGCGLVMGAVALLADVRDGG